MSELEIARKAVQLYSEMKPRPSQVTQVQAAEMLGISTPTVKKLIVNGKLKLNSCGMIPVILIDEVLAA